MHKKRPNEFAQTLRLKATQLRNATRIDEQLLYPLALAVARRQMREWWLPTTVAVTRRSYHA